MNKKLAIPIPVLIVVIITILVTTLIMNNNKEKLTDPNLNNQGVETMEKAAVVYFSRTNNTERIAEIIAEKTGADLYEIEAKTPYTDDDINWHDDNSRANREQNDDSARPEIVNIPDVSEYDTIYLGYPIWWGTMPKIMNTFVEAGALNGKRIVAFCTSGSSGIETSVSALKNYGLDVIGGQRFSSSVTESEVESWLEEL